MPPSPSGSASPRRSACPVESDPITLAKTIATLDHLSGGRVTIGAGFGWNTDELTDHHVPAAKRRTVLKEYLEAMRALWTEEEASYDGEFVTFGASWAYPKPPQGRIPVIIGAGAGPKTFEWIARNADGWMTTPASTERGRQRRQAAQGLGRRGPRGLPPTYGSWSRSGRRRRTSRTGWLLVRPS